jgi:hypothetical protein
MLDLPPQPGPARDAAILAYIKDGDYAVSWAEVTSTVGAHTGTFRVFADALMIEGVRITMSAYLEQTVADMLGATLLTTKIADLLYAQRVVTLQPHTQPATSAMVGTAAMIAQSQWIDSQIAAAGSPQGIIQTVGKSWVLTNGLLTHVNKACNYGWHYNGTAFQGTVWPMSVTIPGVHVIQNPGFAHADQEVDYSQNCVLVARTCFVDGVSRDINDIFQDPTLSALVSAEGPLKILRQPGVPVSPFLGHSIPCVGPNCPTLVSYEPEEPERPSIPVVIAGGIALAATVGGFLGGLALLRPKRLRSRART